MAEIIQTQKKQFKTITCDAPDCTKFQQPLLALEDGHPFYSESQEWSTITLNGWRFNFCPDCSEITYRILNQLCSGKAADLAEIGIT